MRILMNRFHVWLSCIALVGLAGGAFAQDASASAAVGESPDNGAGTVVRMTASGIPIEQVTINRTVEFRDLDLSRPDDRARFNQRIEAAARRACRRIDKLYPVQDWETNNQTCIDDAVHGARKQEAALLASEPAR